MCTSSTLNVDGSGVVSSIFDASGCAYTKLTGASTLSTTFSLAMLYTRTFGYSVTRDHQLDPSVDSTSFSHTPTYFCRDQSFTISVNAEKTASVSLTTPVQIMMERMAQINEVGWLEGDGSNGCAGSTNWW